MLGLDVSNWQPTVDWAKAYGAGARFVWAKATEGTAFADPRFADHRSGARAAGLRVGAYHFARPGGGEPEAEARHFLAVAKPTLGELRPVLDLEATTLGPVATVEWGQRWLTAVEAACGIRPVFYTYPWFWRDKLGGTRAFVSYPLWLASYGVHAPSRLLPDWPIAAHQYTDQGSLPGVSGAVDLNTALDFPAITTEAPMDPKTLPPWLELRDGVLYVRQWVYAFTRWRLVDRADPAKRPPDAPASISQPVWKIAEASHALCIEYAELIAGPIRLRLAEASTRLSEATAQLEAERTGAAMARDQLAATVARAVALESELAEVRAAAVLLTDQLAARNSRAASAAEAARGIVTTLEGGSK